MVVDEDDQDDEYDMDEEVKQANVVNGYFYPSCTNILTTDDSKYGQKINV